MIIRTLTKEIADKFYGKYEHLGNSGLGVWHFGLYDKTGLISVVSFGTPCFNINRGTLSLIAKKYNLRIIQLTRGATKFDAPQNSPSMIIKLSLLELRRRYGNALIVAYSDTKWNEIGTIYQACNFLYLGLTDPGGQCNYIIDGKHMSGWVVRKIYGTRSMDKLSNLGVKAIKIPLTPKHRYIFVNTPRVAKKFISRELEEIIKEYPKRSILSVGSMLEIRHELKLGQK